MTPVTLIYEGNDTPLGEFHEAAVFGSVEEALLQAAWDEMTASNRYPERIVKGALHGSDGWEPRQQRRGGRPRYVPQARPAFQEDAKVLADFEADEKLIERVCKVVRAHWVVHPDDTADMALPGYGSPREPAPGPGEPSPSVAACLRELKGLL